MSIIDRIKKIFLEEKKEQEMEKISFSQLKGRLEQARKEFDDEKAGIKEKIVQEISNFSLEMKEKILALEKVNVEGKKEEEKIKIIVRENLNLYIEYLDKLVSDLKNAENLEPEQYIKRVSQIFDNFRKNSKMAFEKATILIGREIGGIKEQINSASRNINEILKNRNELKEKSARELEKMLSGIKEIENSRANSEKLIEELKGRIKGLEAVKYKTRSEIEEIMESEEYRKSEEAKSEQERKKHELEKDILKAKQDIDLKFLAKFFHADRKKSEIIRKYSENFRQALIEDVNLEIINLTREAGKNTENIVEIREKLGEKHHASDIEQKLTEKKKELGEFGRQLISMQEEITKEKDKIARFEGKISGLKKEILEKAKLLNLEID